MKCLLLIILLILALSFIMNPRNTIVETLRDISTPFIFATVYLLLAVLFCGIVTGAHFVVRRNHRAYPRPFPVGDRRGRVPARRRYGWLVFTVSFFPLFLHFFFLLFPFHHLLTACYRYFLSAVSYHTSP